MQATCTRVFSCAYSQSLGLRNLCYPSTSSHVGGARFQHREQCKGHLRLNDLDILISIASKGASEDEIFKRSNFLKVTSSVHRFLDLIF